MSRTILICLGILYVVHYLAMGISLDAPRSWYLALALIVAFQIERTARALTSDE